MENILTCLTELPEFNDLIKAVDKHNTCAVFGIDTQKAYFTAMLCNQLKKQAFIIVSDENQARIVHEIMPLSHIRKKDYKSIIISSDALCSLVMHPDDFKEIIIKNNDSYNFNKLSSDLIGLGYEFFSVVEGPGQFSIRGGIVDIFPPSEELPCRIEFFGDEVDSISSFDINTQRRTEPRDYIKITPAQEHTVEIKEKLKTELEKHKSNTHVVNDLALLEQGVLPHHDRYLPIYYNKISNILDYADNDTLIFLFDYKSVMEHISGFEFRLKEDIETLLGDGFVFLKKDYFFDKNNIIARIKDPIIFETLPCSINDFPIDKVINITIYQTALSSIPIMQEEIKRLIDENYSITILISDKIHMEELKKEFYPHKNLLITLGNIPYGFILPTIKKAIFSYKQKNEIIKPKKQKFERGEKIKGFSDIHTGDYIVHVNYGVGIYEGIHKVETQGIIKDFIKIRFAGTDVLYIPCSQLDQISKYISGNTDIKVKLNKLGGTEWAKTKQRVKKAVRDLADKLVLLYGERLKLQG
ncbi:MAG: mfd [Clostridia bacterium]|nr:mfd [Clostridia bacterium]